MAKKRALNRCLAVEGPRKNARLYMCIYISAEVKQCGNVAVQYGAGCTLFLCYIWNIHGI